MMLKGALLLLLAAPSNTFTAVPSRISPFCSSTKLSGGSSSTESSTVLAVDDPSLIRNVALVGHSHHGKTALMEWMLFDENVLTKEPIKTQSQLDSDPAEAARAHSIFSHYSKLLHGPNLLALSDTPWGDFPTDAQASADGADAAVLVVSAADSVQSGTSSAYSHCQKHQIPTLVALTKLDRPFLQLESVLSDIKDLLGDDAVPLPLQVFKGDNMEVLPLFQIDPETQEFTRHKDYHTNEDLQLAWTTVEEAVAMTDDDLLVEYLEEGTLAVDDIVKGLKKAVLQHKAVPVVFTAAETNLGVEELLDVMVGVLPSPIDIRDEAIRMACEAEASKCDLKPGIEAGFCARVLHTTINSFGSLSVLRVISNSAKDQQFASLPTEVVNLRTEETFKMPSVATSFSLVGKDRVNLQDGTPIVPGDVIAVPKLPESVRANDIISIPEAVQEEVSEIQLETDLELFTSLSRPVEDIALMTCATVEATSSNAAAGGKGKKKGGGNKNNNNNDDKLVNALRSLAREDLALKVEQDALSGKLLVHCMSGEHLQLLKMRLEDRYELNVDFGSPPVQYRETLIKPVQKVEGKHKKQSGGSGQFGVCYIDMEPLEEGSGVEFESRIKGGVISKPFIGSVEKGVREQLQEGGGPLGGFPVTDVKVTLVDGRMHSVDSKDIAFQSAGKQAVKAALLQGKTRLLQPMERVTFALDTKYQGDVNSIVSRFDGYVMSSAPTGVGSELEMEAILPTASIGDIADNLRATSAGEATFSSEFSHYQPVSDDALVKSIVGDNEESS